MAAGNLRRGELLAHGNTADIWALSATTVVKLLRPGIPEHWAQVEADITSRVHAAGLPAPAVDGVVTMDGRPGVLLERVGGQTMWDRMRDSPSDLAHLVRTLVDLQMQLHDTTIHGIPDLADRVRRKIGEALSLSPAERGAAARALGTLPRGSSLCHGDFHPCNVLFSQRGVVVVDWFDAANGHPSADYARTSLLMRADSGADLTHLPGSRVDPASAVRRAYLDELLSRDLVDEGELARWEAVLAAARLAEPVEKEHLLRLWFGWRAAESGAGQPVLKP